MRPRSREDHASSFTGTQNVIVHTVGFGISASEPGNVVAANDVLRTAAQNGGGQFYDTNSEPQLEEALQDAIRRIIQATFTFATPVVPTTSTTGSTKAYLAAFQSDASRPFWKGYLKAYQRDSSGLVPVDGNGVPLSSALVWEAGQVLSGIAASSRTIYTLVSGTRELFTKSNSTISQSLLGVASSTDRDKTIDRTRTSTRRRTGAGSSVTSSIRRRSSSRRRSWR